jgi:hypothetical protein
MKRFAPLLLVVLALAAAVPAAFADTTTPTQPQRHSVARIRLEILRLHLQLARLEYRVVCHDTSSDRCTQFRQKLVTRLTTVDTAVEQKLTSLNCTSDSTDKRCTLLTKIDTKLKNVIQKLQSGSAPTPSDESGLDSAAASLAGGS